MANLLKGKDAKTWI